MGEWGQLYFFYLNNYIALIFFSITIKLESKFLALKLESKFLTLKKASSTWFGPRVGI